MDSSSIGDDSDFVQPSSASTSSGSSGELPATSAGKRTVQLSSDESTSELATALAKSLRKEKRRRHSDRMREVRADLRFMLDANHQAGGQGVYSGFRLVRTRAEPSSDEKPYVDAFLPLDVAQDYPELLAFEGLNYDDVYCNENLPAETRVVVGPGQFKILGEGWVTQLFRSPRTLWIVALLLAGAAAGLVLWLRR
jgi:hypothetical protein